MHVVTAGAREQAASPPAGGLSNRGGLRCGDPAGVPAKVGFLPRRRENLRGGERSQEGARPTPPPPGESRPPPA